MKTQPQYTTLRITKDTHALVRLIAGLHKKTTEEVIKEAMLERLATAEKVVPSVIKEARERYAVNKNG